MPSLLDPLASEFVPNPDRQVAPKSPKKLASAIPRIGGIGEMKRLRAHCGRLDCMTRHLPRKPVGTNSGTRFAAGEIGTFHGALGRFGGD